VSTASIGKRTVSEGPPEHDRRATRRHLIHVALRVGVFTVLLSALYVLAPLDDRMNAFIVVELALSLLVFILLVAWEIREILRSAYPAIQAVEAVAISIPMLVLTFSVTYVKLGTENLHNFSEPLTRIDALYFSVTVFATVGFGDITATTQAARMVVTFQMLADLVLVGFIAKVLFGAVQHRRQALDTGPAVPDQGRSSGPTDSGAQPSRPAEPVIPPG
jgi:hypothetical protein